MFRRSNNSFFSNIALNSKILGIKSRNPSQVLLFLLIGLSFSYTYVNSHVEATWAATFEDTINVGKGLIALSFNPRDGNLYAATEISGNVSIIEP